MTVEGIKKTVREVEAAAYLGLTVRTLNNYRRKGTLAFREVTGKTRPVIEYDQAELDRLKTELDAKRATTKKPNPVQKPAMPRVTFGLTPEAYAELETEAERFGMGTAEYARRLVREGLESRFQSEATELRNELKQVKADLARTRKDFAAAFEVVLEYTGLDPAEAKKWVTENLR